MLVTASRPKLPKFAAWPITASNLSSVTADGRYLRSAVIRYSDYNVTWFVSQPQTRARPYGILEVVFTRQWEPQGEWTVRVRPVPRERVSRVRALVNDELLPRLKDWLERSPEPPPNATRPGLSFVCYYNENNDTLEYDAD